MRICLTNLQGLGNSIINYPLVSAISRSHEIDLLTWQKNGSTSFYKEIFPKVNCIGFDSFGEIITWDSPHYDMAFALFPAWKREHLSLLAAKSSLKVNFWLKNRPYTWPFFKHMSYDSQTPDFEINANALYSLLNIKPLEEDFIIKKNEKKKRIIIHPTASSEFKFYPARLFVDFIRHFKDRYEVFLISGAERFERDFIQEIMNSLDQPVSYFIRPSFNEIVRMLSESEYFLGLDSAIGHLAALCNCTTLSLWSFANFNRVPPYAIESHLFLSQKCMDRAESQKDTYLDCRDIAEQLPVEQLISVIERGPTKEADRFLKYRQGKVYLVYY